MMGESWEWIMARNEREGGEETEGGREREGGSKGERRGGGREKRECVNLHLSS